MNWLGVLGWMYNISIFLYKSSTQKMALRWQEDKYEGATGGIENPFNPDKLEIKIKKVIDHLACMFIRIDVTCPYQS